MPDVIVTGAGPTGLVAASVLARRGVRVLLLEAGPGPGARSNASTFHPPTLDLLDSLGLAEPLVARGRPARVVQYRDQALGVLAELDLGLLAADTKHPFRLQVEQRELTRIAYDELCRWPAATVRFGVRARRIRQDDSGVVVETDAGTFAAGWVIAADGAHSALRASAGLGFPGRTYPVRYLTVKTRLQLDRVIPGLAPVSYVSGGEDGVGLLALPDHWRIVLRVPPEQHEQEALSDAVIQARARRVVSADVAHYPVLDAFLYPIHRRVAETFLLGRLLLVGDAAHLNSPTGGMGMNSGIHDAYVVAHGLADVLQGSRGIDALVDAARERRRVATDVVGAASERNYREILEERPAARARRRDELRGLAADPDLARAFLFRTAMLDSAPPVRPFEVPAA